MTRKIAILTSGRADYGLLYWLIKGINDDPSLEMQLVVTGMHVSPEFGLTENEIVKDGFSIAKRIEILLSSDTRVGTAKSMGVGMIGFADAFEDLAPDLLVLLGDRFEVLAAAAAAAVQKIPIIHLHGGEITQGAMDDAFRHAITKLSHIHCCAANEYRDRIIQLGEAPERVETVGGLGIDNIRRLKLLPLREVEERLGFKFSKQNLLITFHPETLLDHSPEDQVEELLVALQDYQDLGLIFTMPNADVGSRQIMKAIEAFVEGNSNARLYSAVGQQLYLSTMALVDAVVGNSSSGILEVPSFQKGTVNIGNRQTGRLFAESIVNCEIDHSAISQAIARALSPAFKKQIENAVNPYDTGGASDKIISILKKVEITNLTVKHFFDIAPRPSLEK